ncbi:MAG TPA: potassium transporter Kup [Candidatus Saccharimonadia bacterium]|nr:potassium transporter Kup [Candidatus Saccharimonadia bacterium]
MDSNTAAGKRPLQLAILAIGVVYGDIGTSPLYTMKEAFGPAHGLAPTAGNVLGILSLVLWSLLLVVTIKYVAVILRADNRGEGGIIAMMSLAQRALPLDSATAYLVGILGIFGAALFFGDGVITPAISVLSAVEGLEVLAPDLHRFVLPVTIGVLLALFAVQRGGTQRVGTVFGPIMVTWFVALAVLGIAKIASYPQILAAFNPVYAVKFFVAEKEAAFLSLGAVVLAITGAEALYADIGHFGRMPIQRAWLFFVLPALALNYLGQGALILESSSAIANPFYRLVPAWGVAPMIVLATAAAVLASQAVISGTFSLARQAMQLGYLPRLEVVHTSEGTIGQIYVPWVNRLLLVVVIASVIGFGSSTALASAYGMSMTAMMVISTILLLVVAAERWHLPGRTIFVIAVLMLAVDLAFLAANLHKFADGGWFPIAIGVAVFTLMRTWRRGRHLLSERMRAGSITSETFVASLMSSPPVRVPGTAVFMTSSRDRVPLALLHNLKHNKVLHARNVFLTVETAPEPHVDAAERVRVAALGDGFHRVIFRFGFMETPDVPRAMVAAATAGISFDLDDTTYFASSETVVPGARKLKRKGQGMALWRDKLFALMARNTVSATSFFRIPGNRLVEIGTQVEI